MPHVISRLGREAMEQVAIAEWRGASPVYTRRMRAALGFDGDDVGTIFKGMQLDIGAPHRFMDFRFSVRDAQHGEFHLAHCGALMDVEPMGEEFVVGMCHHIEDPTFDATAAATNPRARMRPVHRPPRTPADRHPHCAWTVEIDDDNVPLPEPEEAKRVARSIAAQVDLGPPRPAYTGALDPDFQLEQLPADALALALDEICLQGQLLAHSFMLAVADLAGDDAARQLGARQLGGIGGVVGSRLKQHGDLPTVLDLHPAFRPRQYVALRLDGDTIAIDDCPALRETFSWAGVMDGPALSAIVQSADPFARVEQTGDHAWRLTRSDTPAPESNDVLLTRFSTGADFILEDA